MLPARNDNRAPATVRVLARRDQADLEEFALKWCREPGIHYLVAAYPEYYRREREKTIRLGYWERIG